MGADVLAACFIIDLPELGGAAKLRALGVPVRTLRLVNLPTGDLVDRLPFGTRSPPQPNDDREAARLFKLAADQGNAYAQAGLKRLAP